MTALVVTTLVVAAVLVLVAAAAGYNLGALRVARTVEITQSFYFNPGTGHPIEMVTDSVTRDTDGTVTLTARSRP